MAVLQLLRSRLTTLLGSKSSASDTLAAPFRKFNLCPRCTVLTGGSSCVEEAEVNKLFLRHPRLWSRPISALAHVPQIDTDFDSEEESFAEMRDKELRSAREILQNLSPEEARKLKIIKLEYEVADQLSGMVPQVMTDAHWVSALQLDSCKKREKFFFFLARKEHLKQKQAEEKLQRRQQFAATESTEKDEDDEMRPAKNTIFLLTYDSTVKRFQDHRLANAMLYGKPLVFDMDYEQFMRRQDCQSLCSQLIGGYATNRCYSDPFHFVCTSMTPNGFVHRSLRHRQMTGIKFLGTLTEKSYMDLFPKERLVYLTPHAPNELKRMREEDIYIVGGFVDKSYHKPVSLARAKEQGIRVARLPLDKYLLWGQGNKSLTIDQVVKILLEQRRSNSWNESLKHVPIRKLYKVEDK